MMAGVMEAGAMELRRSILVNIGRPQRANIALVGCGGTGSYLAQRLARLAGHAREQGVEVQLTFIDPDVVEEKDLFRQLFVACEVGQPKAEALARRYGAAFGLPIRYANEALKPDHIDQAERYRDHVFHLLIGAVDNAAARYQIDAVCRGWSGRLWWLDCGNHHHNGQVILGNTSEVDISPLGYCTGLPLPSVRMPELVDLEAEAAARVSGPLPSCANDMLDNVQSLMINEAMASYAASYVYRLLLTYDLDMWRTYINLEAGNASSDYIEQ